MAAGPSGQKTLLKILIDQTASNKKSIDQLSVDMKTNEVKLIDIENQLKLLNTQTGAIIDEDV